jgi:hypothetical protein
VITHATIEDSQPKIEALEKVGESFVTQPFVAPIVAGQPDFHVARLVYLPMPDKMKYIRGGF